MLRENGNITKRVLMSKVLLNDVKGLAHECMSLSEDLGIPNVVYNRVSKSTIIILRARMPKGY